MGADLDRFQGRITSPSRLRRVMLTTCSSGTVTRRTRWRSSAAGSTRIGRDHVRL